VLKTFPPFPVNGNGSFLPRIPTEDGFQWLAGATFETDATALCPVSAQHRSNLERLSRLLPATAAALACVLGSDAEGDFTLSHWSGTRCASHDRLPLVGPLQAAAPYSLWMSAGMGSRGLSFSAVCAELLVAQLCAEPWPLEQRLARSLDVRRTRRSQRPSPVRQAD
jgi:tRNA 5-methylaminomethyl-2-thiouridine biosynthesis bifunctional protein